MTAIGLVYAPRIMRVVRGSTLSVREEVYIRAARATGCGDARIVVHHVLPNVMGPLVVQATVLMGQALLAEAGLSFLGLGVEAPMSSLGTLIKDGAEKMEEFWWLLVFPGAVLVSTLLALNFFGDGLRDAFDPRGDR